MLIDNLISNLETRRNSLEIAEESYHAWLNQKMTMAFMLDLEIAQAECLNQLSEVDPNCLAQIAAWQAVYKQFSDLLEWLPQELIEDN